MWSVPLQGNAESKTYSNKFLQFLNGEEAAKLANTGWPVYNNNNDRLTAFDPGQPG